MEVLTQEARESYEPEIVVEMESSGEDQLKENIGRLSQWVLNWLENRKNY